MSVNHVSQTQKWFKALEVNS